MLQNKGVSTGAQHGQPSHTIRSAWVEPTHVTKGPAHTCPRMWIECAFTSLRCTFERPHEMHIRASTRNAHSIHFQPNHLQRWFQSGLAQGLTCSRSGSGTSFMLAEGGLFSCHVLPSRWSSAECSTRQRLWVGEVCRRADHTYSLQAHRVHTYTRTSTHTAYTGVH